jgi:hypothetical protein
MDSASSPSESARRYTVESIPDRGAERPNGNLTACQPHPRGPVRASVFGPLPSNVHLDRHVREIRVTSQSLVARTSSTGSRMLGVSRRRLYSFLASHEGGAPVRGAAQREAARGPRTITA